MSFLLVTLDASADRNISDDERSEKVRKLSVAYEVLCFLLCWFCDLLCTYSVPVHMITVVMALEYTSVPGVSIVCCTCLGLLSFIVWWF